MTTKLPRLKTHLTAPVPRQFFSTYRSREVNPPKIMNTRKIGTATDIFFNNTQMSIKDISHAHAVQQMKEILKKLEFSNPTPLELLRTLSNCSTPYSSLLKLASEELEYATKPARSQKLDELERESAVNSAKKEVEIQQAHDRLTRTKNEGNDLEVMMNRFQKRLDGVNTDINRLNDLLTLHGVSIEKDPNAGKPKEVLIENELMQETPPPVLDEELYKQLWAEHIELLNEIDDLQVKLKEIQEQQTVAFREVARKRIEEKNAPRMF